MPWSSFQEAIFDAVLSIHKTNRDLVVLARAGTGKTTTMTEAIIRYCRAGARRRVLTCAFNRLNAEELADRLQGAGLDWRQAQAKTLNSVGLATCRKAWGRGVQVDGKKGRKIAKAVAEEFSAKTPEEDVPQGLRGKISRLATLTKITLTDPENIDAMTELCNRHRVADEQSEIPTLRALTAEAMQRSKLQKMTVDFDDQLWFPHTFQLSPWKHDLVVVDEAQDMNAAQLELARKSVRRGGRLVAVGDDRQAIYGWRGAESDFLGRMVTELNAQTLPLPRTYRCGKAIVEAAREIVPDYEADAGNVEGEIRTIKKETISDRVRPGDFVISRSNAPLLPLCLELLKRGVPAAIQGRDLIGQLTGIVERSGCERIDCLLSWLDAYEAEELEKLAAADADDDAIGVFLDRVECLRTLAPGHETCAELLRRMDEIFSDRDWADRVTLSSAHRSKGLERDRVYLLAGTFRTGGQEDNVRYVAMTRARTELIYAV